MNVIDAICNLVNNPKTELKKISKSSSRANSLGDSFEEYIKDLFAQVTDTTTEEMRNELLQGTFSYLGNSNNPPDAMLWYGDAIEMKKLESENGSMPLNSSYPKHKVYSSDPMINQACKDAETWTEKDIIYTVGIFEKNTTKLKSLAFVYGEDYCASKSVYETKFCDPQHIASTNIATGRWNMKNPFIAFDYLYKFDNSNNFNFMCIINDKKYLSFKNRDTLEKLKQTDNRVKMENVNLRNPNKFGNFYSGKLITFSVR